MAGSLRHTCCAASAGMWLYSSARETIWRGAGIGANGALFAVMQRIGVSFDASNGIALVSRVWLESNGNIAAEVPTGGGFANCMGSCLSGAEGRATWGMLLLR